MKGYETLDAVVVVGCMVMVSGMIAGFFLIPDLGSDVTPILASLATAIFGIPVVYGAFRWGNTTTAKHTAEVAAETNKSSTAALAQIAGAGPQPPAQPLGEEPQKP
jgi:hypothetical protein